MLKKDYFSGHSKLYATFRPTYPKGVYDFLLSHVRSFEHAWDCATGNGQVARHLATYFKNVYATDISQSQLDHAFRTENIQYSVGPAEQSAFPNHFFNLITVGQALHWFDTEAFFKEVLRVGKPGAMLAVWGYNLCSVNPAIDAILYEYYRHIVGKYWDAARNLVDTEYKTISFPLNELQTPPFKIEVMWSPEEFAGYISTWSATQKFIREEGFNPVPDLINKIIPHWKNLQTVEFPVFMRAGIIQ